MHVEKNRIQAIKIAQAMIDREPLFLDTETTGLGPRDEIVEVAILDHDGNALIDSLIRPINRIPADAVAIHGITEALVRDAPTWLEVWPEVEAIFMGKETAIYNAEFDLRLMKQSHRAHKMSWNMLQKDFSCLMQLYAQFYGMWDSIRRSFRWQSLENAGRQCRIPLPNTHRARDDAALARAVLLHIASSQ